MPKRQRVHATIELALRDARIEREDKILQKLKLAVRQSIPQGRTQLNSSAHPALYTRFRGRGFPLKNLNNRKLPQWRSLSQWMKAQLTALCIAQFEHRQIRVRLHDDVRNREEAKGTDLKVYIRDRITRTLGEGFGEAPWYLFVIEDLDKDGKTLVRPHAHGIMRVRPLSLEKVVNQKSRTGYERSAASIGRDKAELRAGIAATRQLLNQATGNGQHSRREVGGISQKGNVWMTSRCQNYQAADLRSLGQLAWRPKGYGSLSEPARPLWISGTCETQNGCRPSGIV